MPVPSGMYHAHMVRRTQIDADGNFRMPAELRDRYGWRAGDRLIIEEQQDGMLIRAADSSGGDDAALGESAQLLATEVLDAEDRFGS